MKKMKMWVGCLAAVMSLSVVASVLAADWYECDVKWAGAGGGGNDPVQANRILSAALAAMASNKKVMVFTDPVSFSEIGGLYMVTP